MPWIWAVHLFGALVVWSVGSILYSIEQKKVTVVRRGFYWFRLFVNTAMLGLYVNFLFVQYGDGGLPQAATGIGSFLTFVLWMVSEVVLTNIDRTEYGQLVRQEAERQIGEP